MPQTRDNRVMFDGIALPEWGPEAPTNLFSKFNQFKAALALDPAAIPDDDFVRLLGRLTMIRFHERGWTTSLRKVGICPDDLSAEGLVNLLAFCRRTTLDHPHEKVLLKLLTLRLASFVFTAVRRAQDKAKRMPVSETDLRSNEEDDQRPFSRTQAVAPIPTTVELNRHLRDAEDRCLRDIPGNINTIVILFRLLSRSVTRGIAIGDDSDGRPLRKTGMPTQAQLPQRLRERVSREVFNLVTTRIRREVSDFIATRP